MLHSGIDLHKRTAVISTVDADGQRVREAQLPTTRAALTAYFAALPGGPAAQRAVVESTSTWYWLRDCLVGQGIDLRLGHSKHITPYQGDQLRGPGALRCRAAGPR